LKLVIMLGKEQIYDRQLIKSGKFRDIPGIHGPRPFDSTLYGVLYSAYTYPLAALSMPLPREQSDNQQGSYALKCQALANLTDSPFFPKA
jgi:hypothetical protein